MEITGTIILALPEQVGTKRDGSQWTKREYVLETQETYPKKVHFAFLGDKAGQYPLKVGDAVKVSVDISSREFKGRWYTDILAWKAEPATAPASTPAVPAAPAPQSYPTTQSMPTYGDDSSTLPF